MVISFLLSASKNVYLIICCEYKLTERKTMTQINHLIAESCGNMN